MPNPTRQEVEAEIAAVTASLDAAGKAQIPADTEPHLTTPPPIRPERPDRAILPESAVQPAAEITPERKPAPSEDDRDNDPEYWKNRFKTVEGMQRKEHELFEQQLRQQQEVIELLKRQTTVAAPDTMAQAPVMPTRAAEVTDEMVIAEYGEDAVDELGLDLLRRDLANQNRIQALQSQVETLVQTTQSRDASQKAEQATRAFWDEVSTTVPDAERKNRLDASWHEWLEVIDPTFGVSRKEMLQSAVNRGDSAAVARAMAQHEQIKKANPSSVPSLPSIAEQAQATGSAQRQVTTQPQVTTYKQSQVDKYYDDRQRGRLEAMYTPQEILQMETQIKRAAAEGRIVPG